MPSQFVLGDEGMYLYNELPVQKLREKFGFEPTEAWAEHLRLSSVRFNSGGSGSFISSDGLVLTNHHVASETLQKLSSADRDLIADGYLASSLEDELRAPDLELNQLVAIEDVTAQVNAGVSSEDPAEAADQRRATIATIEKESKAKTGLRSDVITLYGGAKYHLYQYRKYTDVRLVWAPETAAAFFGGDADNFEYPRYNLDATIMRVYEDGKPAKLDHFLSWRRGDLNDGELVFVSGNPGRTQRIFTVAALKYLRDDRLPYVLDFLRRKEILMQQFSLGGAEAKRRARDELFGIQNARKAYLGMLAGLQDPQAIQTKGEREEQILKTLSGKNETSGMVAAWEEVAEIQDRKREMLGNSVSLRSQPFDIASNLVLIAAEDQKPDTDRLRGFTDAARESLLQRVLSTAPIYDDLERVKLTDELSRLMETRGAEDELVLKILAGKGPRERAAELIGGTKVNEVAFRKKMIDGGIEAIESSDDPMIQLAQLLEDEYRRLRKINEEIEEEERQAYAEITKALSNVQDSESYPDATFTLRLAFGEVKGYEQDGQWVKPFTVMSGAYAHALQHAGQEDFDLPPSWMEAEGSVNPNAQLNFVCTADIIGGNSGSPVVDRKGELVGLIFDGNIQSLTSDYVYSDQQGRAVSVAGTGILEALRSIYNAKELADSIGK